ncbi:hypothetical protein SLEP1_g1616 [Rubroshorea leprosula]|uniref:Uncharacterized protein n=1 Tax=Rubroshorea leprosula TaxID=152421 RepID=A0AAV5HED3_9ROSI|nr:hypothetical protein SLEP1_g1616 [Rubroshorea leprosula]
MKEQGRWLQQSDAAGMNITPETQEVALPNYSLYLQSQHFSREDFITASL